jgi:hypothetical protein
MTISLQNYPEVAKYRKTEKYHATKDARIARQKATGEWQRMAKNRLIKHNYGITLDQYDAMVVSQGGVCAICNNPETMLDYQTKAVKSLAIDHCHSTNRVRGLLCQACNVAIGRFKDDVSVMEKAIQYIKNRGVIN